VKITEDKEAREALFEQLLAPRPKAGHPHQHELWPCVRRGAAERFAQRKGIDIKPSRRAALYFLRGESAEALIALPQDRKPVFIYKGVALSPDQWTGEHPAPFTEIKSTNLSSISIWKLVKKGGLELLGPYQIPVRSYFEQCAIYCVATGTLECKLTVFFQHGDYADRRTKCPECGEPALGELENNVYRTCGACKFKTHVIDLRVYRLAYLPEELAYFDREVFDVRAGQFRDAADTVYPDTLRTMTAATPCFLCRDCDPGKVVGCEHYGSTAER